MCEMDECFDFDDAATTEIDTDWHTLSQHDALPISAGRQGDGRPGRDRGINRGAAPELQGHRHRVAGASTPPRPDPLTFQSLEGSYDVPWTRSLFRRELGRAHV